MTTQLAKLKQFMADGNHRAALRLAASWGQLGPQKARIERGRAADVYPEFYRSLGKNPEQLVAEGVAAIRERYGL